MNDEHYNIAYERSILSSFLFDPIQISEDGQILNAGDFYLEAHKRIFEAMIELDRSGKPIDEIFIKELLIKRKAFDERAMIDVMTANPIASVQPYIEAVKRHALTRSMVTLGIRMQRAEDEDALQRANEYAAELSNLIESHATGKTSSVSICDIEEGETRFILKEWLPLPVGTVSIIAAPGGTGKSWAAIQIGFRYVREHPNRKAALWLSEDQPYETKNRAKAIASDIMVSAFSEFRNVEIIENRPPQLISGGKVKHDRYTKLRKMLKPYGLIVLDPLRAFYGGDENSNSEANLFMGLIQDWAAEDGVTIVLLHHSKKSSEEGGSRSRVRGASAFVDACRTVYEIDKVYANIKTGELDMTKQHSREFTMTKDNYGAIRFTGGYKFTRHITPRSTAKETAVNIIEYQTVSMPVL